MFEELPSPEEQLGLPEPAVQAIGPWVDSYRLTVYGYEVPYLEAHLDPGTEDQWSLSLDHRYGLDCSHAELERWLPFLANAMAVAAGYTSFGEHAQPTNPFHKRLIGLAGVPDRHEHEEPDGGR